MRLKFSQRSGATDTMPRIDLGHYVEGFVLWASHRFSGAFDAISHLLTQFVGAVQWLLSQPPPLVTIALLSLLALAVRRRALAAFSFAAFLLIVSTGLWSATVETLALVLVSTAVAVVVGLPLGIWCASSRAVGVAMRPALDFMQTLPAYVYLIPAVFFFGVGLVPAVVATAIFAIPPAVRMTELGIRQVDAEMVEAANAFGAHPWQIMLEVQLPLAMPSIMAGVNQVIMLSLSMVVISGLVGAAGLGSLVVSAVTQLDIAAGFNSGLAVVILAIFLDRFTAALGQPRRRSLRRRSIWTRMKSQSAPGSAGESATQVGKAPR
jgi:glycine betaine/proline transport system permease protein